MTRFLYDSNLKKMTFAFIRTALALTTASILCVTACGSNNDEAKTPSETGHLEAALAGQPEASTIAAAKILAVSLNSADWYYLTKVLWPPDFATVYADPRLQKAIAALQTAGDASTRAVRPRSATSRGLQLLTTATSPDAAQKKLDAVRALLQHAHELVAIAVTPDLMVATVQVLAEVDSDILPNRGVAADPVAHAATIEFFAGGGSVSLYERGSLEPCCRGEVTFGKNGSFVCYDQTSCKSKGEPENGGISVGDSTTTATSGGPKNVCIVAPAETSEDKPFAATCAFVAARSGRGGRRFTYCYDADPNKMLVAPQLASGENPDRACVSFTNADATAAGVRLKDCDHETAPLTCYCCP